MNIPINMSYHHNRSLNLYNSQCHNINSRLINIHQTTSNIISPLWIMDWMLSLIIPFSKSLLMPPTLSISMESLLMHQKEKSPVFYSYIIYHPINLFICFLIHLHL